MREGEGSPRGRYAAAVGRGELRPDPAQARAVELFEALHRELAATPWPPSRFRLRFPRLFPFPFPFPFPFRRRRPGAAAVRGLYLWGGVGRGKTLLMDAFFAGLAFPHKRRTHFYRFMQSVHAELKALRAGRTEDPLGRVAARWAAEVRVLCLDELHVEDIADAMILGPLLEGLIDAGTTLVATSNAPPSGLYEGGLQRERFLPAAAALERRLRVVELAGGEDHRLRALERAEVYHWPLDEAAHAGLEACFADLAPAGAAVETEPLVVNGRPIAVVRRVEGVAWFRFDRLCDGPRGASDYVELARRFHTVLLSGVPVIGARDRNRARRFIGLVDALYDRNVNLVVSAAAPPGGLYPQGRYEFEYRRTRSRLEEMGTRAYLGRPHLA